MSDKILDEKRLSGEGNPVLRRVSFLNPKADGQKQYQLVVSNGGIIETRYPTGAHGYTDEQKSMNDYEAVSSVEEFRSLREKVRK